AAPARRIAAAATCPTLARTWLRLHSEGSRERGAGSCRRSTRDARPLSRLTACPGASVGGATATTGGTWSGGPSAAGGTPQTGRRLPDEAQQRLRHPGHQDWPAVPRAEDHVVPQSRDAAGVLAVPPPGRPRPDPRAVAIRQPSSRAER